MSDVSPATERSETDFIIVGAGSAGCVLANRLTAGGRFSAPLVEAGGWDRSPALKVPIGYGASFNNPAVNWRYNTEPVAELGGRTSYWPRGKVIGGSSAINAMLFVRGQAADYDGWATQGNPGWSFADVLPHFKAMEDSLDIDGPLRGQGGPMAVSSVERDAHPLTRKFVAAATAAGMERNRDYNGDGQDGVGFYQQTTRGGWRCSSARGYLHPIKHRENLQIITGALVEKITFDGRRATGISYRTHGQRHQVSARREVIVCAGAINSPQLLELSGVGDGQRVRALGINVVCDQPSVGENLQDHLAFDYIYAATEATLNQTFGRWPGRIKSALTYLIWRRGPLSLSINQGGGFFKTSNSLDRPNMQLYFAPLSFTKGPQNSRRLMHPHAFQGFMMGLSNCHPKSRGSVHIRAAEACDPPAIVPGYLTHPSDLDELVDATHWLRRIASCEPLKSAIDAELSPGPTIQSREDIAQDIRARAGTVFHPCGTCAMGPNAATAVVDSQLRVHGVAGLRVVDASIFPLIPSGNINAPAMMVAENGAAMILRDQA
jgi:choline dehydrogenase